MIFSAFVFCVFGVFEKSCFFGILCFVASSVEEPRGGDGFATPVAWRSVSPLTLYKCHGFPISPWAAAKQQVKASPEPIGAAVSQKHPNLEIDGGDDPPLW